VALASGVVAGDPGPLVGQRPDLRLPDAYFANVDVFWTRAVGRSMYADFNYDMLTTPLILVALVAAIWWRWRSGRPSLEPDSSATT
jgi:hypothetical protein